MVVNVLLDDGIHRNNELNERCTVNIMLNS